MRIFDVVAISIYGPLIGIIAAIFIVGIITAVIIIKTRKKK